MNGIGIDIVEIERIKNNLSDTFVEHILSQEEINIYNNFSKQRQIEYLSGRFAAKEAIIKCLSDYEYPEMKEITIINNEKNKPIVKYKNYKIDISISHEKHYTVAIATLNLIN